MTYKLRRATSYVRGVAVALALVSGIATAAMTWVKWRRLFDATPPIVIAEARAVSPGDLATALASLKSNGVVFDGRGTIPLSTLPTPAKTHAGASVGVYMQLQKRRDDCVKTAVALVVNDPAIPLASITLAGMMPKPIDKWRGSAVLAFQLPETLAPGRYDGAVALTYNCPQGFVMVQSPPVALDVVAIVAAAPPAPTPNATPLPPKKARK